MDLETFFPSRDRQELAMRFNSVLAAPGFDVWTAGEPPDLSTMLFTAEGRPRIAIVSVSHLEEAQRMTAVALVLNAAVEWTRRQGGSTSLTWTRSSGTCRRWQIRRRSFRCSPC
jgi:hypothetical protein